MLRCFYFWKAAGVNANNSGVSHANCLLKCNAMVIFGARSWSSATAGGSANGGGGNRAAAIFNSRTFRVGPPNELCQPGFLKHGNVNTHGRRHMHHAARRPRRSVQTNQRISHPYQRRVTPVSSAPASARTAGCERATRTQTHTEPKKKKKRTQRGKSRAHSYPHRAHIINPQPTCIPKPNGSNGSITKQTV